GVGGSDVDRRQYTIAGLHARHLRFDRGHLPQIAGRIGAGFLQHGKLVGRDGRRIVAEGEAALTVAIDVDVRLGRRRRRAEDRPRRIEVHAHHELLAVLGVVEVDVLGRAERAERTDDATRIHGIGDLRIAGDVVFVEAWVVARRRPLRSPTVARGVGALPVAPRRRVVREARAARAG